MSAAHSAGTSGWASALSASPTWPRDALAAPQIESSWLEAAAGILGLGTAWEDQTTCDVLEGPGRGQVCAERDTLCAGGQVGGGPCMLTRV